jgi:hypothetical protein
MAAKNGEDGRYHLEGEVNICSTDTQLDHLKAIKGILNATGKRTCLLVFPLPRYVTARCCLNPNHCSNQRYQDLREHQLCSLGLLRKKNFKDFLFFDGRKNVKVLEPCINIQAMSNIEVWGVMTPSTPSETAIERIAASVVKIGLTEGSKRARTGSMESEFHSGPDARRGQRETELRAEWNQQEANRGRRAGPRGPHGTSAFLALCCIAQFQNFALCRKVLHENDPFHVLKAKRLAKFIYM